MLSTSSTLSTSSMLSTWLTLPTSPTFFSLPQCFQLSQRLLNLSADSNSLWLCKLIPPFTFSKLSKYPHSSRNLKYSMITTRSSSYLLLKLPNIHKGYCTNHSKNAHSASGAVPRQHKQLGNSVERFPPSPISRALPPRELSRMYSTTCALHCVLPPVCYPHVQ